MQEDDLIVGDVSESTDAALERNELLWVRWLRAVMWINIVCAAVVTLYGLYQISFISEIYRTAKATGRMWLTPDLAFGIATIFGLPALYLYASIGCLSRKPPARVTMLIYIWCRAAMIAFRMAVFVWTIPGNPYESIAYLSSGLIPMIYEGGLLVLTLLFVTRPSIKSLFGHHPTAGFAVLPSSRQTDDKQARG